MRLRDRRHPQGVTFGWWGIGDPRTTPLVEVRLDFGDAMNVTAVVEGPGSELDDLVADVLFVDDRDFEGASAD